MGNLIDQNGYARRAALNEQFQRELLGELDKMFMIWNDEMYEWHEYAMKSLDTTTCKELGIKQESYFKLLEKPPNGLSLTIVMALTNCIGSRTPREMEMEKEDYAYVLKLNSDIATRWNDLVTPVKERIERRLKILKMN